MLDAKLTIQCRAGSAPTGADGPSGPLLAQGAGEAEPSDFQRMLDTGRPAESEPTLRGSGQDLATDAQNGHDANHHDPDGQPGSVDAGFAAGPTQIDAMLGIVGDVQLTGAPQQGPVATAPALPVAACLALPVVSATSVPSDAIAAAISDPGAAHPAGTQGAIAGGTRAASQGATASNAAAAPVGATVGDATRAGTNTGVPLVFQVMADGPDSGGVRSGSRSNAGRGPAAGAAASAASALALQAAAGDPRQAATAQAAALPDPRTLSGSNLDAAVLAALRATAERSVDAGAGASSAGGSDIGAVGSSSQATAGMAAAHHGPAAREASGAAPPAPPVNSPVGSLAWRDQIAGRVSWMIDNGEQQASLRLSPENLGPLEVRIAVREGEASVWFGAAQPETRAALEQAMPRLREMLAGSGLALTNSGVFSDSPRDPWRALASAGMARASLESGLGDVRVDATPVRVARGLLDLYA